MINYVSQNPDAQNIPLVFIRPVESKHEDQYNFLKILPDFRFITISVYSNGYAGMADRRLTLEDQINDIDEFLEKKNISEFFLLGFSSGAGLAAYLAVKNSGRVKGLILAECPPEHPKFSNEWAELVKKNIPGINGDLVNGLVRDLARINFLNDLSKMDIKVLLLKADAVDSRLPLEAAEKIKNSLKNCDLKVISNSSHELFSDRPEETLNLVKDFMSAHN